MNKKIEEKLPWIKDNVSLSEYTTYKIGGPARYFFIAKNKEDLIKAVKTAKEFKLPIFILGGGSNLLVSDKGFSGLVVKIEFQDIQFKGNCAFVGAGADLTKLAYLSAENGLSGLEWVAGIPGTVGGAIYGHAQAFGKKISEAVKKVEALDSKSLKIKEFSKKQCRFSLKNSIFKENRSQKKFVVISAVLQFKRKNAEEIKNQIAEHMDYRKTRHPINFPSAGSTFVNPEIIIKDKKLLEKFPELIEYNKKKVIPAGYLITKCGLSGKRVGGAQISKSHANFIVNLGGAKSKDVLALISLAKTGVKKTFGIDLEQEVQMLGF